MREDEHSKAAMPTAPRGARVGVDPVDVVDGPADANGAFRLLLAANPQPMWVYDLETLRFLEVNEAAVVRYGYRRDEFLEMTLIDIRPPEDQARLLAFVAQPRTALRQSGRWRHVRADGTVVVADVTSHVLSWEGRPAALCVANDVTQVDRLEAELARRALFDEATGLATARLFSDRARAALARAVRKGGRVGVLLVGLGALEEVATAAGEEAAETMVVEVAARLRRSCDPGDTVARLGDGRLAVLREAADDGAIVRLAATLVSALEQPVLVPGWGGLKCMPWLGVALATSGTDDAASLVRDAASAMRRASEMADGRFVVSDAELRRAALEALETEQDLEVAARLGQLELHYQPVVDLAGGDVATCEALLRWDRPRHGLVGPDVFVPLAERCGLIVELGSYVIERAIEEAARWELAAATRPKVAVNLSARQLHDEHLVDRLLGACVAHGLPVSSVAVELTESAFVRSDDDVANLTLAALRDLGVEVAIDDFGTGYSALAYLKHLPVDVVKIDRAFVRGLGTDEADALVVDAIIRVAHGLGLKVVAEGVETGEQLDVLRSLGCDAAQGFLLARPVPSTELPQAIDRARLLALAGAGLRFS